MRIGLRVLSNPLWTGGIHYVLAWATALSRLPAIERPEVVLLVADERGQPIAEANRHLAAAVEPFDRAAFLDLDLVYPATQLFEAPIGAPWAGWIPDWQCRYLPELFDQAEYARRDLHFRLLATRSPALAVSSATGLGVLLMATLFPVMVNVGISRGAAAAICAQSMPSRSRIAPYPPPRATTASMSGASHASTRSARRASSVPARKGARGGCGSSTCAPTTTSSPQS